MPPSAMQKEERERVEKHYIIIGCIYISVCMNSFYPRDRLPPQEVEAAGDEADFDVGGLGVDFAVCVHPKG